MAALDPLCQRGGAFVPTEPPIAATPFFSTPPCPHTRAALLAPAALAVGAQLEATSGAAPVGVEEATLAGVTELGGSFPPPPACHPCGKHSLSLGVSPVSPVSPPPRSLLTLGVSLPRVPVPADGGAERVPQDPQQVFGQAEAAPHIPAPQIPSPHIPAPHIPAPRFGAGRFQQLPLGLPQRAEAIDAQLPSVPDSEPAGRGDRVEGGLKMGGGKLERWEGCQEVAGEGKDQEKWGEGRGFSKAG